MSAVLTQWPPEAHARALARQITRPAGRGQGGC